MPQLSWLQPETVKGFYAQPVKPLRCIKNEYTIDDLIGWMDIHCPGGLQHIPTIDQFEFRCFLTKSANEKHHSNTELLCLGTNRSAETVSWANADGLSINYFQQDLKLPNAQLEISDYRQSDWHGPQDVFRKIRGSSTRRGSSTVTKARREVFVKYIFLAGGRLHHLRNIKKENVPLLLEMACRHIHLETEKAAENLDQAEKEQPSYNLTNSTLALYTVNTQADITPVTESYDSVQATRTGMLPSTDPFGDVDAGSMNQNVPMHPEIAGVEEEEDEQGSEGEPDQFAEACSGLQDMESELPFTLGSVTVFAELDTNTVSTCNRLRIVHEENSEQLGDNFSHRDHSTNIDNGSGRAEFASMDSEPAFSENQIVSGTKSAVHARTSRDFLALVVSLEKQIAECRKDNSQLRVRIQELEQSRGSVEDIMDVQVKLLRAQQTAQENENEATKWKDRHEGLKQKLAALIT